MDNPPAKTPQTSNTAAKAAARSDTSDPDLSLPASSNNSIYQGLSERAKFNILIMASLIAILNLMAAWYFANQTSKELVATSADMAPFVEWVQETGKDLSAQAKHDLSARSLSLMSSMKLVSNKQFLILTSFGGAFALLAIGFALFIIGADGAFKVMANAPGQSKFALSSTAPGLFCFLIAAWLITTGINFRSTLDLPNMPSEAASAPNSAAAAPSAVLPTAGSHKTSPTLSTLPAPTNSLAANEPPHRPQVSTMGNPYSK